MVPTPIVIFHHAELGILWLNRHCFLTRKTWVLVSQNNMADESEVEIRGIKRPLVENYSDDEEEEEARRKEGESKISILIHQLIC